MKLTLTATLKTGLNLTTPNHKPGYHVAKIERGELGELSKIREELEEAMDAEDQGVDLMVLLELSDMLGAVEAYLDKKHPSLSIGDLRMMARVTKRAFINGHRESRS